MPAEWEPHAATWLSWPRRDGISFPDKFDPVPAYWVTMTKELSAREAVHINVFDGAHREEVMGHLIAGGLEKRIGKAVHLHDFPACEPWCRDHGPLFVVRDKAPCAAIVDWGYNAWGDKYPPYDLDNAVPARVAEWMELPLFDPQMILEGGSIDVNGQGTLLTTTSCLLHPNRNPSLDQQTIETRLRDYLGVRQVIWLGDGVEGDDTDGHIDDIARFVDPHTVVTVLESDPQDPNFEPLMENYRRLLEAKDQDGKPLRVCTLPMPARIDHEGMRLPASYANFYVANGLVLAPVFGDANDGDAIITLRELFPKREVIGLDCRDLIWGLGAFHCVTQQQPLV